MLFQGQVVSAVPSVRATGNPNATQTQLGELAVSQWMPRYSALAWSQKIFTAYAAAQTLSVAATGMTGLQVYNQSAIVNLHILKVAGEVIVTSATMTAIALAWGKQQTSAPTGQTAATSVTNNFIGGAAPAALALNAGTFLAAPTAQWPLLHNTAAIGATGEDAGFFFDFEGSIVVPPQCLVAFVALGAASAAAAVNLSIKWVELPI
jgi:hypothetical protein